MIKVALFSNSLTDRMCTLIMNFNVQVHMVLCQSNYKFDLLNQE